MNRIRERLTSRTAFLCSNAAILLLLLLPGLGRPGEPTAAVRAGGPASTLQQQLLKEDVAVLARLAREQGDASRGAITFYRPELACTRCHTAGEADVRLGPDLARAGKEATDVYLVESLLSPSKVIKKGFETVAITTKAGKTLPACSPRIAPTPSFCAMPHRTAS